MMTKNLRFLVKIAEEHMYLARNYRSEACCVARMEMFVKEGAVSSPPGTVRHRGEEPVEAHPR